MSMFTTDLKDNIVATKQEVNSAYFELEHKLGDLEAQYNISPDELILMCDQILGDGGGGDLQDDAVIEGKIKLLSVEPDSRMALNLNSYDLIPICELLKPKEGVRVIENWYWQIWEGKALVYTYKGFYVPQCNKSFDVAKRFLPHGCEVIWIEKAYFQQK